MKRRDFLVSWSLLASQALAGARTSSAPDAGTPPTKALPFPHGQPLVAFDTSPDGRLLATGAECTPAHADDPLEGVACWDLQTLTVKWATRLDGGVGLNDQLARGVAFSPDGRLVGANFHTNAVALLDAATGSVLTELNLSSADGPPPWCWSADPARRDSVVVLAEGRHHLAPAKGRTQPLEAPVGRPIALDASGLAVVARDALSRGATTHPLATKNGARVVSVAVSSTALVVGTEPGELLVIDRRSFSVRHRVAVACGALSVSRRGDVVVVILPNGTEAVLVREGRLEPVPGPLARRDWLAFNDGRAVAVSPDGARVATVSPAGEVVEVTAGKQSRLGVVEGADTVIWPSEGRVVALGQRVVGVIEPGRGVVLTSRLG
ncbi:MAG: hypothetical protein GQE15_34995 [Archangiaceae bacterium]|nr:hypothetical protein [Archangiaceae bacterium]